MLMEPVIMKRPIILSLITWTTVSMSARAEENASPLALYPPEVVAVDAKDAQQVRATIAAEFERQNHRLASVPEMDDFIREAPEGGCVALDEAARTRCLGEFARSAGAHKALLLVVSPRARNELRISAQVVDASGTELKNLSRTWPRPTNSDPLHEIEAALRELVPQLELASSATQAVTRFSAPPLMEVTPFPAAPGGVVPRAPAGAWKRPAGWIGVGAGTLLLGFGTWALVDSSIARGELAGIYERQLPHSIEQEQKLIELRDRTRNGATMGAVGLTIGSATTAAGIYLLMAASSKQPQVAVTNRITLFAGPGQVGCTGVFP